MLKKISIFTLSILFITVIQASAMEKGSGSHGHDSNHKNSMMKHSETMMKNDGNNPHDHSNHQEMNKSGMEEKDMAKEAARKRLGNYMAERKTGMYHIGDLNDRGTHYTADVHSHEGKLIDKVMIDKKSGNVHSLMEKDSAKNK